MRIVTANEVQDWLRQGELLEKDSRGPKVLRLSGGEILKIFRSRRNPMLARLRPDAKRFSERAIHLQALGIQTPNIRECCWIDRINAVSACIYFPLPGTPLDKLFYERRNEFDALLPHLASYIRHLHECGIYFRSLHLGNIVRTPEKQFGLIDFLDIRFKNRPLGRVLIRRNFQHLHNYLKRRNVQDFPWDELLLAYEEASKASS